MASHEVVEEASSKSQLLNTIEEKHSASLLLISRDFEKCLEVCHNALSSLKLSLNSGDDDEANHQEEIEEFVVIFVQAYAELDRWQEVLPYITDLYSGIENVSPNILKLCLLLHAKVREFSTCSAIYNIWNRSNQNKEINEKDMEMLVDIYVSQILIPSGNVSKIHSVIRSSRLEPDAKNRLIALYSNLANQNGLDGADPTVEQHAVHQVQSPQDVIDRVIQRAMGVLRVVARWLWSVRPRLTNRAVTTLASLAAVVFLFTRGIDYSSRSHFGHIGNLLKYFLFKNGS